MIEDLDINCSQNIQGEAMQPCFTSTEFGGIPPFSNSIILSDNYLPQLGGKKKEKEREKKKRKKKGKRKRARERGSREQEQSA